MSGLLVDQSAEPGVIWWKVHSNSSDGACEMEPRERGAEPLPEPAARQAGAMALFEWASRSATSHALMIVSRDPTAGSIRLGVWRAGGVE